jgi:hypothetical protein
MFWREILDPFQIRNRAGYFEKPNNSLPSSSRFPDAFLDSVFAFFGFVRSLSFVFNFHAICENGPMSLHRVTGSTGEPINWKITHFANISGSEEFVAQLVMELPELVDASTIYGKERDRLREAILVISMEGLMPAFEHLKKIRASVGQKLPELNRKQLFEDFERVLWHAYKDLTQKAAKLMEPEIGFLFQNGKEFEKGLLAWEKKRPKLAPTIAPYFRKQRADWQNALADFRNYHEHKDDRDSNVFAGRYEQAHSEKLFDSVWRTIADILAMLISLNFPEGALLDEIPREQRDPARPRRFRFQVKGITF